MSATVQHWTALLRNPHYHFTMAEQRNLADLLTAAQSEIDEYRNAYKGTPMLDPWEARAVRAEGALRQIAYGGQSEFEKEEIADEYFAESEVLEAAAGADTP